MIPPADKSARQSGSRRLRKIIGIMVIGALLLALAVFLIRRYIGDLRPALFPASQNIADILEEQVPLSTSPADSRAPASGTAAIPLHLPSRFKIGIFARNLGAPRVLAFSPRGTLFVSLPRDGNVLALPGKKGAGRADEAKVILRGLNTPHGMAFYEDKLFVAEETGVTRYHWDEMTLTATRDKALFALPAGGNHVTRSLVFNGKGQMFVSLGSTCNVCYEKHPWLAAVITSDKDGNNPRLFARGLRNSVFLTINPRTDEVWAGDMGRDFLGDDLPPEEINIIRAGKDYGWPLCYGNKIHDAEFDRNPSVHDPCATTEPPVFEYQAHSAPLGLAFINSPQFPQDWQGDLLVAYHGSWNRSAPSGFKVVRFTVRGNTITGSADFLTGFLRGREAIGRPADMIFDEAGSLYLSDDKAGVIYKISKQ